MQTHYEINVSLNGHHLFATAERSGVSREQFDRVLKEIVSRFPVREGFLVTAYRWEVKGRMLEVKQ